MAYYDSKKKKIICDDNSPLYSVDENGKIVILKPENLISPLNLKFKKLTENAVVPQKAHDSDAAFDIIATSMTVEDHYIEYGTGLVFETPMDHAMLIYPRSSISKKDLALCNSVGVVDPGYRGELKVRFRVINNNITEVSGAIYNHLGGSNLPSSYPLSVYKVGDKIAQMVVVPLPRLSFTEVENLDDTDRGQGGFGSSGE